MLFPRKLCDRVVTIYRPRGDKMHRTVTRGFYHYKDVWYPDRFDREFLLVLWEDIPLAPGDRIYDGVGPKTVDWDSFLPVNCPGLSQVGVVTPCFHRGSLHHWEVS